MTIFVSILAVQRATAAVFGVSLADLNGRSLTRPIARPRQVAMYLAREMTARSLPEIGRMFGGRDHSTVRHAIEIIGHLAARDKDLAHQVKAVRDHLARAELEPLADQADAAIRSTFDALERSLVAAARAHPAEMLRGLGDLAAALREPKP